MNGEKDSIVLRSDHCHAFPQNGVDSATQVAFEPQAEDRECKVRSIKKEGT